MERRQGPLFQAVGGLHLLFEDLTVWRDRGRGGARRLWGHGRSRLETATPRRTAWYKQLALEKLLL